MTPTQPDPRWATSGWGHRVRTQDELFRAVSRIGSLQAGRRYVWRGVSDARYRVRSSLLRHVLAEPGAAEPPTEKSLRARERAILREARSWGLGFGPTGFVPDLHLLTSLQHHGVPTRLLDVTTNPMTAMWFACQSSPGESATAGALFAFDVTFAPQYETLEFGPTAYGAMSDPPGWSLGSALTVSARDHKPFMVRPTVRDARMQAQEGLFIGGALPSDPTPPAALEDFDLAQSSAPGRDRLSRLFAPDDRPAGRPMSLPFCALVIPPAVKSKALPHLLGTYDRRFATMFPDVEGFAAALTQGELDLTPPSVPDKPVSPQSTQDVD